MTVVTEQNAAVRTTEGSRPGASSRGKPGRPKGSLNKPKSLVPAELANEMLLTMKDQVPPEHFKYLQGVIRDGKAISTKSELDTLILLLSRNLYPALIGEMKPVATDLPDGDVKEEVVFRRDVTERLKVLNSLLSLRNQVEKREEPEGQESPLIKLWASRKLEGRVAVLIQPQEALPEPKDVTPA